MTAHYTEDDVITAIADLTRPRLVAFIQAELIIPLQTDAGTAFREIDIARLELLCELSDQFDFDEDALGVILSLIDQLHGVRADLRTLLTAIEREPDDVRARLGQAIRDVRLHG